MSDDDIFSSKKSFHWDLRTTSNLVDTGNDVIPSAKSTFQRSEHCTFLAIAQVSALHTLYPLPKIPLQLKSFSKLPNPNLTSKIKGTTLSLPVRGSTMESYGSGQRPYGGERRMEVVSGKSHGWSGTRSPDSAQGSEKPRRFSDPEAKRKKRIAKYKVYGVEGKVKATLRKGLRWIKKKCSQIAHGY
ncbi:ATP-dependent DNA helicase Q 1 [Spatholobus suberectus]|nr:ATP-dependent DNA helicase Q 1 [Spatholobus suberectus]